MTEMLGLKFPKHVKVENTRLSILYYIIFTIFVGGLVGNFIYSKAYLTRTEVYGKVHFWATNWWFYHDGAEKINAEYAEKEFCKNPSYYEYCDSEDCTWHYHSAKCLDLCVPNQVKECFSTYSRWFKEDLGLFLPTYYNETVMSLSETGQEMQTKTQQAFVKGVEEILIEFDHEYFLDNLQGNRETGFSKSDSVDGGYKEGLLTILVDENDAEIKRWQPGSDIAIPVRKILELIGKQTKDEPVDIDGINEGLTRNFVPGAKYPQGVLTRISGISVSLSLSYQNHHDVEEWQGPICIIRVFGSAPWVSKPVVHSLDEHGSMKQRYFYGIRIRFDSTGSFKYIDSTNIMTVITTLLVWMGVAQQIVFYFAIYGLGSLGHVYRRVLVPNLNLQTEVVGLAARLIGVSSSFQYLEDTAEGISLQRMFLRFRSIFKTTTALDEGEIKRFVNYVFKIMSQESEGGVNMEEYVDACSSNEPLAFDDLVSIFDADRKKSIAERVFADDSVRSVFKSDMIYDHDNGNDSDMRDSDVKSQNQVHIDITQKEETEKQRIDRIMNEAKEERAKNTAKLADQQQLLTDLEFRLAENDKAHRATQDMQKKFIQDLSLELGELKGTLTVLEQRRSESDYAMVTANAIKSNGATCSPCSASSL